MKKISFTTLIYFSLLCISRSVFGEIPIREYPWNEYFPYILSDYIAVINDGQEEIIAEPQQEIESEGPLRRFEITFFISAPFIFIVTFLSLHVFDVIKKQNPNVNVWKDYKPALLTGTFGISSAIAAREAWINMETNNKKNKQSDSEEGFFFYVNKDF